MLGMKNNVGESAECWRFKRDGSGLPRWFVGEGGEWVEGERRSLGR